MHELIAWCGFAGGWLLVAGPIYQAAIELEEESVDRDSFASRFDHVPRPRRVSPWWWLIPPVAYVLNRRRNREHRDAMVRAMTKDEIATFVRFTGKATGWAFVAGGASLIAVKETWELAETYEWPLAIFVVLVVVMLLASAANTTLRVRRGHDMIGMAGNEEV